MNNIKTLKDKNPYCREKAARELGETGNKSAVYALIEALKDRNCIVRSYASKALGRIGNVAALERLTYVANNDKNERVGKTAKEAIKEIRAK